MLAMSPGDDFMSLSLSFLIYRRWLVTPEGRGKLSKGKGWLSLSWSPGV